MSEAVPDYSPIDDLNAQINRLYEQRRCTEMADDFAWSNGSLRRIDNQIAALRQQLDDLSRPSCQTQTLTEAS